MSSIPRTIRIASPFLTRLAKALKIAHAATQAPTQVSNPLRASLIDSAPAALDSGCVMYRDYPIYFGSTPSDFWVCIPGCPTEYGTLAELVISIDIYLSFMPC